MADSRSVQQQSYPLPVYGFRVEVGPVTMGFSEVTGIEVKYDEVTYRHGLTFTEGEWITTFYYDSFLPLTLCRGTIPNSGCLALMEWLEQKDQRSMMIDLYDAGGSAVLGWQVRHAVPVRLEAPNFAADADNPAIETLELRARNIRLVKH